MYLANATDLQITETDDGWIATSRYIDDDGLVQLDNFDLNDSAAKVIEYLTVQNDARRFVADFCKQHEIDRSENSAWVTKFLNGLVAYGVAVVTDTPSQFCATIRPTASRRVPNNATIEVTNTCNESCDHCYVSAGPHRSETMTLERFKSLCDELSTSGVLMLELTGGEVFMHRNFTEMLDYACRRFVKVALLTNATILTQRALDVIDLHKHQLFVSISLDSVNSNRHNLFRHHRNAFEKTCRNIRKLTELGVYVRVTSAIWEGNKWELEDLCKLAKELGAKGFSFNFVDAFGRGEEFAKENRHQMSDEYAAMISRVMKTYSDMIPTLTNNDVKTSQNCGAAKNSITISPTGKLRPCNLFPQDFVIGDVSTPGSWIDAVSGDLVKQTSAIPSPSVEHGCNPACPNRPNCSGCYLKGLKSNCGKRPQEMCSWVKTNKLYSVVKKFEATKL